ncbi:MAG: NAD-dependent epimerase/dehydratase family protein [Melioribacteraceae bacterium]|nr:NAD-dependent epimerase/dehydratase family protein [Melioribacteraceae bacterium]
MLKQKIVVTGGAGFIGSHIVEYWHVQGAEVHVIDNLRTGLITNIEMFPGIVFHKGSVTDRELVFKVMKDADYVHHLAAFISVPESIEKPHECYDININGLLNVLDASQEFGIKKIIFSSSAAVYGDNSESPKRITTKAEPKSPYGLTKLEGEEHLKSFHQLHNLGAVSLRYFNVFGPRQDPKSQYAAAIPIFIYRALKNEPIIIFGDGSQTRDFIYVKDVVDANIAAAIQPNANGVFNIASGTATSIKEIAEIILNETGSKSEIVFEKGRPGDIKHSLASIFETDKALNFSPKIELKTGLKKTIEYFANLAK